MMSLVAPAAASGDGNDMAFVSTEFDANDPSFVADGCAAVVDGVDMVRAETVAHDPPLVAPAAVGDGNDRAFG